MRKLIWVLLNLPVALVAQQIQMAGDTAFVRTFGGPSNEEARCVIQCYDNGFAIGGTSSSFGQGYASFYLVKTDSMGKHRWSKTYGGFGNDWCYYLNQETDKGYFLAGYSNSFDINNGYDGYFVKTDSAGSVIYEKYIGGEDWDFMCAGINLPDSGYVLAGESYTNSNGGSDAWFIRLNKNGDTLWTRHYGNLRDERINSLAFLNGKIYAAGKRTNVNTNESDALLMKLDLNGSLLSDSSFVFASTASEDFRSLTFDANKKLVLCGAIDTFGINRVHGILCQIDTLFNLQWYVPSIINGIGTRKYYDKVLSISGNEILPVGTQTGGNGGTGMLIIRFDENGNYVMGTGDAFGGIQDEHGYGGIRTSSGRVALVGTTNSFGFGGDDMYLVIFKNDQLTNNYIIKNPIYFQDTLQYQSIGAPYAEPFETGISIYPNPATTKVRFELQNASGDLKIISIRDVTGRSVFSNPIISPGELTLDCNNWNSGIYFIQVEIERVGIRTLKLVKE